MCITNQEFALQIKPNVVSYILVKKEVKMLLTDPEKDKPKTNLAEKDLNWWDKFTLDSLTGTWVKIVPKTKRTLAT